MEIPRIGEAKGIFEVFLPGAFLFIHIVAFIVIMLQPMSTLEATDSILYEILNSTFYIILVFICFGYLLGVFLRLLRPGGLDKISGFLMFVLQRRNRNMVMKSKRFPYFEWIEELCIECYQNEDITKFYRNIWADKRNSKYKRQFFNYCKNIIYFNNKDSSKEVFSAEAMIRFLTGICYALVFSIIGITICLLLLKFHSSYIEYYGPAYSNGLIIFLAVYMVVFIVLLLNFRISRIKEVETVFISTFNNKELF